MPVLVQGPYGTNLLSFACRSLQPPHGLIPTADVILATVSPRPRDGWSGVHGFFPARSSRVRPGSDTAGCTRGATVLTAPGLPGLLPGAHGFCPAPCPGFCPGPRPSFQAVR